jgi:hypothetical protein
MDAGRKACKAPHDYTDANCGDNFQNHVEFPVLF